MASEIRQFFGDEEDVSIKDDDDGHDDDEGYEAVKCQDSLRKMAIRHAKKNETGYQERILSLMVRMVDWGRALHGQVEEKFEKKQIDEKLSNCHRNQHKFKIFNCFYQNFDFELIR